MGIQVFPVKPGSPTKPVPGYNIKVLDHEGNEVAAGDEDLIVSKLPLPPGTLPTHAHFNPLWIMAFDNFPLDVIEHKKALEKEGLEKNAWFTFYHDPFMRAARFDRKGNITEKFE